MGVLWCSLRETPCMLLTVPLGDGHATRSNSSAVVQVYIRMLGLTRSRWMVRSRSKAGNPELTTVLKVIAALGLWLKAIEPAA